MNRRREQGCGQASGREVVPSTRRLVTSETARADFAWFLRRYRRPKTPATIRQEPFDGDARHYARLLALSGDFPEPRDVIDYVHDISYMDDIQADLFACLLPVCLQAWQYDLMGWHDTDYDAFVEYFSPALARRPLVDQLLTAKRAAEVKSFMRDALLDRIDLESSLSQAGSRGSAYSWIHGVGSFCVFFPELEPLWREWWRLGTRGQSVAALQYISCLMYEDHDNPIFAPWTRSEGGGPPRLWETDGHIRDQCWHPENVAFFRQAVTVDYMRQALTRAAETLDGLVDSDAPARMCSDFVYLDDVVAHRLAVFPEIVSRPLLTADLDWPAPPAA